MPLAPILPPFSITQKDIYGVIRPEIPHGYEVLEFGVNNPKATHFLCINGSVDTMPTACLDFPRILLRKKSKRVLRETGRVDYAKFGEWYEDHNGGLNKHKLNRISTVHKYPIFEEIEE